jgi:hypothetical protein
MQRLSLQSSCNLSLTLLFIINAFRLGEEKCAVGVSNVNCLQRAVLLVAGTWRMRKLKQGWYFCVVNT